MDRSYQLFIRVVSALRIDVGALGPCEFPAGIYVYTGSARRNLAARLARHRSATKRLRWHIDYLLAATGVGIERTLTSSTAECELNRAVGGTIPVPRFGASDCRCGCISHLRFLGTARRPRVIETHDR